MKCLICNYEGDKLQVSTSTELTEVDCPRCGGYLYTDSSRGMLLVLSPENKSKLSVVIRNSNIQGRDLIEFDTVNIQGIIDNYIELTVQEKIDKLMLNLSISISQPNEIIKLNESIDWPLSYSNDQTELAYYIEHLKERKLLEFIKHSEEGNQFRITIMGWEYISKLEKRATTSKKVFVAMNFDKEFDELYEKSIKKAIEDNGYISIISKRAEHIDLIDDFIMAEIKDSRFVVAEFTGQKHGVYFEAGYARGLGIPVIWVCRKDEIGKLHFDINHYNQIDWETPEELMKRLYNRVREVI